MTANQNLRMKDGLRCQPIPRPYSIVPETVFLPAATRTRWECEAEKAGAGWQTLGEVLEGPRTPLEEAKAIIRVGFLHHAVERGDTAAVIALLNEGADPNARGQDDETLLHIAVYGRRNTLAIVTALLDAGADPNAENENEKTPLHLAADDQDTLPVVEALLAAGADPNAQDDTGETPPVLCGGRERRSSCRCRPVECRS